MGGDAFNWHCDGNTTQANLAWLVLQRYARVRWRAMFKHRMPCER